MWLSRVTTRDAAASKNLAAGKNHIWSRHINHVVIGDLADCLIAVSCPTATRAPVPPASTPPSPPPVWGTAWWSRGPTGQRWATEGHYIFICCRMMSNINFEDQQKITGNKRAKKSPMTPGSSLIKSLYILLINSCEFYCELTFSNF